MTPILQTTLPYNPFEARKLPGIQPLDMADWLRPDEAYSTQMAERARLLENARNRVLALDDSAKPAAQELLSMVLEQLCQPKGDQCLRPDGQTVSIDVDAPLDTLGRVAQQDFCILQKPEGSDEHILTAAILCFPASWTLAEKFMQPLIGIHLPVDSYDSGIAARVQRLFDGVQPGRPLWRFNALWYHDADLFHPRSHSDRRAHVAQGQGQFLRSELQSILRLPKTNAVVFSIHTRVLSRDDVARQWGDIPS